MQEVAKTPESLHNLLLGALGLAPALIGTALKWLQDNSKTKRRSELSDRLSGMSKLYNEQNPGSDPVLEAVHTALGSEILAICEELKRLQADAKQSSLRTFYGFLSDLLLLYRPHDFLAWVVHILFYAGFATLLFALLGFSISPPQLTDFKDGVIGFVIFGLLLLGVQRIATRLHTHFLAKHV